MKCIKYQIMTEINRIEIFDNRKLKLTPNDVNIITGKVYK